MTYFLHIDGIDGESVDQAHRKWHEVSDFSWGLTQSATPTGGGGGAGRPTLQPLIFSTPFTAALPLLFDACVTGSGDPEGGAGGHQGQCSGARDLSEDRTGGRARVVAVARGHGGGSARRVLRAHVPADHASLHRRSMRRADRRRPPRRRGTAPAAREDPSPEARSGTRPGERAYPRFNAHRSACTEGTDSLFTILRMRRRASLFIGLFIVGAIITGVCAGVVGFLSSSATTGVRGALAATSCDRPLPGHHDATGVRCRRAGARDDRDAPGESSTTEPARFRSRSNRPCRA